MAHDKKLAPPHALPRVRACSIAPRPAQLRSRFADGRRMHVQSRLLAGLLFGLVALSGCGRTDLIDIHDGAGNEGELEIDFRRELTLTDDNIVLVELVAPAPSELRVALIALEDGVALDDVIATLCPDDEPQIELDATGETPEMRVYRDGQLRGIIWM